MTILTLSLSLTSKCQVSLERRVLDLESEAMRGPCSILTVGNILSLDFFCFYTVKTKMSILAFLCVCEIPDYVFVFVCDIVKQA